MRDDWGHGRSGATGRDRTDAAGGPAERGQILLIGALIMAMLFVMLAVAVNGSIYAGLMSTDYSTDDTGKAVQALQQTERALANGLTYVNANHATDHVGLTRNLTATLATTERSLADHYATRGAAYEMSAPDPTNRTAIVQDDPSRNFTDATGATAWTLVDGVDSTGTFRMRVDRDGLAGPGAPERFGLSISNGSTTWELMLAHDGDTGDIKLEVTTPTGSNTCQEKNETATVDLVNGSLAGEHCRNLAFDAVVDGPYEVRYANADNVSGEYRVDVTGANAVHAPSFEDDDGSPRAEVSIASATVTYTYETNGMRHESTVTAP